MNSRVLKIMVAVASVLALAQSIGTAVAAQGVKLTNLRCEYLSNPLGLDVPQPRLSWALESVARAQKQTAYRVLVASDLGDLAKDKGDLWDSGKVASDESGHIEYAGKPLASGAEVFWKVRVWDRDGHESAWSQPAVWSMGLLKPGDWKGKWIGSPTAAESGAKNKKEEPAPMFRKAFCIEKPVRRATAYICGLGYYELRLNGKKVGDSVLDPAFTRYDRRALYVTHDVTAQLARGTNAVGVILGNGWFNYTVDAAWYFDEAAWRAWPKMILQLVIEFTDKTTQTIVSDGTWKFATSPIISNALLNGETYDARLERPRWDTTACDDKNWMAAKVVEAPKGVLSAQMTQPIRATQELKTVKLTQPKPGVFVFDIGQNIAGVAQLLVRGPAGTTVTLMYGESLNADGTVDQKKIKEHTYDGEFQVDRYILKGTGTEVWRPRFVYSGFRYVQVNGFPGKPTPASLSALVVHTDLESTGNFECSNELLNDIQRCTRWSYVNNFHGHPTDCPQREKNGWTGDAHLAAEAGLYNFEPSASYTKWMRDFHDEQRPTGELPGIVPTGGWGYKWGNGPAWDSAYVLIPWYLHQYRGDRRILAEHYDRLKLYVDYLTSRAKEGVVSIGLGDWCPAKTKTPVNITSTGYYYADAMIVSKIAAMLGKKDDAVRYAALAADIKKAFNQAFFNPKTKQYGGGTQTALSCALYQGLVEPQYVAGVVSNLVANVAAQKGHLDCGILGAKYLLHALTDNGRADVAYTVATQTTAPSWGNWIKRGATTLWEDWEGKSSLNHIMFGDISAWFYETLAGIRPDPSAPGFRKIIIRPAVVGDLKWVRASHDSLHGRIVSDWKHEREKLVLDVTIPANTTATVFIPAKGAADVTEGGKPLGKVQGVKFLRAEDNCVVLAVESGVYHFVAKNAK
ncbi:MAG: glycoside hydrolase family 78 protein [Verrucomicrobia bacterium]|nr:glycoside hydrolase family 78 protein [Verrucomicrobiota bacterium]